MQTPPESYINPLLIVSGSLTVVTGLAWNNAFTSIFADYLDKENEIRAKFIYAIILTIIVIFFIYGLFSLSNYVEKKAIIEGQKIKHDISNLKNYK